MGDVGAENGAADRDSPEVLVEEDDDLVIEDEVVALKPTTPAKEKRPLSPASAERRAEKMGRKKSRVEAQLKLNRRNHATLRRELNRLEVKEYDFEDESRDVVGEFEEDERQKLRIQQNLKRIEKALSKYDEAFRDKYASYKRVGRKYAEFPIKLQTSTKIDALDLELQNLVNAPLKSPIASARVFVLPSASAVRKVVDSVCDRYKIADDREALTLRSLEMLRKAVNGRREKDRLEGMADIAAEEAEEERILKELEAEAGTSAATAGEGSDEPRDKDKSEDPANSDAVLASLLAKNEQIGADKLRKVEEEYSAKVADEMNESDTEENQVRTSQEIEGGEDCPDSSSEDSDSGDELTVQSFGEALDADESAAKDTEPPSDVTETVVDSTSPPSPENPAAEEAASPSPEEEEEEEEAAAVVAVSDLSSSEDEEEAEQRRHSKRKDNWRSDQRVADDDSDIEAVDFDEDEAVAKEIFPQPDIDPSLLLAAAVIEEAKKTALLMSVPVVDSEADAAEGTPAAPPSKRRAKKSLNPGLKKPRVEDDDDDVVCLSD